MGFPPIGIMSLSSVLKRAGHEVLMFDQANPDTPNEVIVAEVLRRKPDLVGMSFLSTTSYPYAKILARQIRAADAPSQARLRRRLRDAQRRSSSSGSAPRWTSSAAATASSSSSTSSSGSTIPAGVLGVTWQDDGRHAPRTTRTALLDRNLDQWPFPDRESLPLDFVESMPLDVPAVLSLERFTTMQTSRGCPWPCVFCDIPIFNEGKWRSRSPRARRRGVRAAAEGRLRRGLLRRRPLPAPAQAHRGDLQGHQRARHHDPVGLRGPRRLRRAAPLPGHGEGRTAARSCSASRAAARRSSTA